MTNQAPPSNTETPSPATQPIWRDPLWPMLALGALLFGAVTLSEQSDMPAEGHVDAEAHEQAGADLCGIDPGPVEVDETSAAILVNEWNQRQGAPPTPEEREALFAEYIDAELIYREGLRLGLDRGDPEIRVRVIQQTLQVIEDSAAPAVIDDEALRTFYAANQDRYELPARYSFDFAIVPPEADAAAILAEAAAADSLEGVGEAHRLGRSVSRYPAPSVRRELGDELVAGLDSAEVNVPFAVTLLDGRAAVASLRERHPAIVRRFEEVHGLVARDVGAAHRSELLERRLEALRAENDALVESTP